MKYACGLHLSSAQLKFYSQPPSPLRKQTNVLIYGANLLYVKLFESQENSAINTLVNTILFRRLKAVKTKLRML